MAAGIFRYIKYKNNKTYCHAICLTKEHKETLLFYACDWVLAQVVQRHYGASLLGDLQRSSVYGHGQPAVGSLEWAVGPDGLQISLPKSATLWLRNKIYLEVLRLLP